MNTPVPPSPLLQLRSVSTQRLKLLERLGIHTLEDLLHYYPRGYQDWSSLSPLSACEPGQEVTCLLLCVSAPLLQRRGKRSWLRAGFADYSGSIRVTWFNQAYLQDKIEEGKLYLLHGKIAAEPPIQLTNPAISPGPVPEGELRRDEVRPERLTETFVRPLYPLTAGMSQGVLRGLVRQTLGLLQDEINRDPFSAALRRRQQLCARRYALENIHFPATPEGFRVARKRLAFEELFFVQLGLRLLRSGRLKEQKAPAIRLTAEQEARWKLACESLPFQLTAAQRRVLGEINEGLAQSQPVDRLVQGDVGSGKTVLAALSLYRCVLAGYQGLLMAPTSILAGQHEKTLENLLSARGVRQALLTGQTPAARRRKILRAFAEGELDLLIGTHAVLNEEVKPCRPSLVITDEQHRFGVRQRLRFQEGEEGNRPHVLVMSATPIPRSLALILYGDLDISIVDERPPGRKPVQTYTVRSKDFPRVWNLMERELAAGRQAYVICPLKTETEEGQDLPSAEETARRLQEEVFPRRRVGLLHGGMKEKEKQAVMEAFYRREMDILVSTTVVEVGVDNPNASLLLILEADRFGLAQLHQLRGRVGRGDAQAYCLLHSDSDKDLARERLRSLCRTNDGYLLAEQDLRLRGPGDFFGTRQHGLPEFRLANLYEDRDLLAAAREEVDRVLAEDPQLQQHPAYRQELLDRLGDIAAGIVL